MSNNHSTITSLDINEIHGTHIFVLLHKLGLLDNDVYAKMSDAIKIAYLKKQLEELEKMHIKRSRIMEKMLYDTE